MPSQSWILLLLTDLLTQHHPVGPTGKKKGHIICGAWLFAAVSSLFQRSCRLPVLQVPLLYLFQNYIPWKEQLLFFSRFHPSSVHNYDQEWKARTAHHSLFTAQFYSLAVGEVGKIAKCSPKWVGRIDMYVQLFFAAFPICRCGSRKL